MNNTKALQLMARFSLPPNKLGYCGRNQVTEQLLACINEGQCDWLNEEIAGFRSQLPYLKTIATVTGKDYLDYEVIEAYWLGNDLLKQFSNEHYPILLRQLEELGLPDFYIHTLKKKVPNRFIPFHLFSVQHMNQLPANTNLDLASLIDNCRIRWERVASDQRLATSDQVLGDLKAGDVVAIHWQTAVKKLTKREVNNLMKWSAILRPEV